MDGWRFRDNWVLYLVTFAPAIFGACLIIGGAFLFGYWLARR